MEASFNCRTMDAQTERDYRDSECKALLRLRQAQGRGLLREAFVDELDDILCGGAGKKDLGDAALF
jgi:hypothetical protein